MKIMWNFQGSWWFGRGISKGSNTILWNFHGWSFVLSGISRGLSERNKKFQGGFKKVCPRLPCLFSFSEKAQSLIHNEFNGNNIE